MTNNINWDDPEERLALIERVGPEEYNRLYREQMERETVATINGFPIRHINTRFGRLFSVDGTGKAFATLGEANAFAEQQPAPNLLARALKQGDLDAAIAPIQKALGIATGDVAGQAFSGVNWRALHPKDRRMWLARWLQAEVWEVG